MQFPPERVRLPYEDVETFVAGGRNLIQRERVNWQTAATGSGLANNQNPIAGNHLLNPFEMLVVLFKSVWCFYILLTANKTDGGGGAGPGSGNAVYQLYNASLGAGSTFQGLNLIQYDQGNFLHFSWANTVEGDNNWSPHGPRLFAKEFQNIRFIYMEAPLTGAVAESAHSTMVITLFAVPTNVAPNNPYICIYGFQQGTLALLDAFDITAGSPGPYTFDLTDNGSGPGYYAVQIVGSPQQEAASVPIAFNITVTAACDSFAHHVMSDIYDNATDFDTIRITTVACQQKVISAPENEEGTITSIPLPPGSQIWSEFINHNGNDVPAGFLTDSMMNYKNNYLKGILDTEGPGGYMVAKPHGIDEFKLKRQMEILCVDTLTNDFLLVDIHDQLDPDYEVIISVINTQNILAGSTTGGSAADFIFSFGFWVEGETSNRILESLKLDPYADEILTAAVRRMMYARQFGSNGFEWTNLLMNIPAIALGVAGAVTGGPVGAVAGYATGKQIQSTARDVFEGAPTKKTRGPGKKGRKK